MTKRNYDEDAKAFAAIIEPANPTTAQFAAYQAMYDYFNRELFGGQLKPVILNFSRMNKTYGFFAPKRWGNESSKTITHEISLNPSHLALRSAIETVSTLVHEMVHCWQQEHGKPGRGRYHNGQWASKMEASGLMPSTTGMPGGAKVGDRVSHYIMKDGLFEKRFKAMPPAYLLPWSSADLEPEKKPRAASKLKYSCLTCEANAWGRPGLNIMCGDCEEQMEVEAPAEREAA